MCIIMCIGGVPLQDNFIFTVAVHITYRCVIRTIGVFLSRRSHTFCRPVQRNIDITRRSISRQNIISIQLTCFNPIYHRFYSIYRFFITRVSISIKSTCRIGDFRYFLSISIYIERSIDRIGRQVTPRHHYVRWIFTNGHNATPQLLFLQFGIIVGRLGNRTGCHTQSC